MSEFTKNKMNKTELNFKSVPFTLDAWRAGGVPVTRRGQEVTEIFHLRTCSTSDFNLVGVVDGSKHTWTEMGRCDYSTAGCDKDLVLRVPIKFKRIPLTLESAPRWIRWSSGAVSVVQEAGMDGIYIGRMGVFYSFTSLATNYTSCSGSRDGENFGPLYTEAEA